MAAIDNCDLVKIRDTMKNTFHEGFWVFRESTIWIGDSMFVKVDKGDFVIKGDGKFTVVDKDQCPRCDDKVQKIAKEQAELERLKEQEKANGNDT